jgi:hypothetical protein
LPLIDKKGYLKFGGSRNENKTEASSAGFSRGSSSKKRQKQAPQNFPAYSVTKTKQKQVPPDSLN